MDSLFDQTLLLGTRWRKSSQQNWHRRPGRRRDQSLCSARRRQSSKHPRCSFPEKSGTTPTQTIDHGESIFSPHSDLRRSRATNLLSSVWTRLVFGSYFILVKPSNRLWFDRMFRKGNDAMGGRVKFLLRNRLPKSCHKVMESSHAIRVNRHTVRGVATQLWESPQLGEPSHS